MGVKPAAICDVALLPHKVCNLACAYCEKEKTPTGGLWRGRESPERIAMRLAELKLDHSFEVIVFTGGEVTVLPNFSELVRRAASLVEVVKIDTNGVQLSKKLFEAIRDVGTVLRFSTDGHLAEMNRYRFGPETNERVWHNIRTVLAAGLPVELNCVLHDANIERVPEYIEFLTKLPGQVVTFLSPVRGPEGVPGRVPNDAQQSVADELLREYDHFASVLPPRAYVELLRDSTCGVLRTIGCTVPYYLLSLDWHLNSGRLCACAGDAWTIPEIGNRTVFLQSRDEGLKRYRPYLERNIFAWEDCWSCNSEYRLLELYHQQIIGDAELAGLPTYASPLTRAALERVRGHLGQQTAPPIRDEP